MKYKKEEKTKKQPESKNGEPQELRQQIEDLQKEKDELFAKLQRVSADYTNFQRSFLILEKQVYSRFWQIPLAAPAVWRLVLLVFR